MVTTGIVHHVRGLLNTTFDSITTYTFFLSANKSISLERALMKDIIFSKECLMEEVDQSKYTVIFIHAGVFLCLFYFVM